MASFTSTVGFQPEMVPSAVANRKMLEVFSPARLNPAPLSLKTIPVGELAKMPPSGLPGTLTTNGLTVTVGLEVLYRVLVAVPWLAIHQLLVGPAAIPQGFTRFESSTCAGVTLVSSDTRLVCTMTDDNRQRRSSDSSPATKPACWRGDVPVRSLAAGARRVWF